MSMALQSKTSRFCSNNTDKGFAEILGAKWPLPARVAILPNDKIIHSQLVIVGKKSRLVLAMTVHLDPESQATDPELCKQSWDLAGAQPPAFGPDC